MIRLSAIRVLVAAIVGGSSVVVVLQNGCRGRVSRALPAAAITSSASTLRSQIEACIAKASSMFGDNQTGVVDADALIKDVHVSLQALVSGIPDDYYRFRIGHGAIFKRKFTEEILAHWYEQSVITSRPTDGMTDLELLQFLWGTADERRMVFLNLLPEETSAGRGAVVKPKDNKADWPLGAGQFSSALFSPAAGPISIEDGLALDDTEKSAHLTFAVQLVDGNKAYIRLNYFYDGRQKMWFPVTILASSEAKDYWPWPSF